MRCDASLDGLDVRHSARGMDLGLGLGLDLEMELIMEMEMAKATCMHVRASSLGRSIYGRQTLCAIRNT
jgi:hypothetical protein